MAVRDLTTEDRLFLQGPGFGRTTLLRTWRSGSASRWATAAYALDHPRPRAARRHPHHAHRRGRRARHRRLGRQHREDRAQGGRVGRAGMTASRSRERDRRPARLRLADPSSTCSAGSPSSTRDRHAKRFTRGLRARPRLARGRAPRPLHGRRDGRELRRASPTTSPSTAPRSCSTRSSSCCSSLRHQVQALRDRRGDATTAMLPDGQRRRRRVPGRADVLASGSAARSRVVFEREIGFLRGARRRDAPRAAQRAKSARTATARGPRRLPRARRRGGRLRPDRGRHAPLRGRRASSSTTAPSTCSSTTRRATWRRSTW